MKDSLVAHGHHERQRGLFTERVRPAELARIPVGKDIPRVLLVAIVIAVGIRVGIRLARGRHFINLVPLGRLRASGLRLLLSGRLLCLLG